MERTKRQLTLYVAALTRKRPEMLRALLVSLAKMTVPEQCHVKCLIVENDTVEASRSVVEECRPSFKSELLYVLEPELGIPFGRNRAAKEAIAGGADLLLFIDDDEVVADDWLVRMIAGYRSSNAVLLGAPLRAKLPTEQLSIFQRKMFANIEARYKRKEDRARTRATLNATNRVTIVTSNWLGELSIFRDHNIWFDENMRFTGGTDAKFFAEVRKAGLAAGWVADAIVYETVPLDRLSFMYQYQRARDQSNTNYGRKPPGALRTSLTLLQMPHRLAFCLLLFAAVPVTGGKTLLAAARSLGWVAGKIGCFSGQRSALYFEVTGS
ncbi:glycosyltransferase family 2 protein [Ensifer sp. MPMI2T]|nr:glycosyltransferase family 2 protein [Ensifer sp. MPMI2T]